MEALDALKCSLLVSCRKCFSAETPPIDGQQLANLSCNIILATASLALRTNLMQQYEGGKTHLAVSKRANHKLQ